MHKKENGSIFNIDASYTKWKELFFKYFPLYAIWVELIIVSVFYALVVAYMPTQNGDNIEHIHSSFLVASGKVPYLDFFQHHNPLLWFLFAPVVQFFAYNATITEIVCFISFLIFLKSLVYVYRIGFEFIGNKFWSLVAAAVAAIPSSKLYAIDFRPDNYMVFCLMGGIYYYFRYFKDKRSLWLTVAFIWFTLSFLFAQKALFPLFILGISGLYFWYKKEIKTKDMLEALVVPIVGISCFAGYLFYHNMVELYFLSNYTFNLNLVEGFDMNKVVDLPLFMLILFVLGWAGAIMSLFGGNRYLKILAVLFVAEFLQRRFYFSPYTYYYWLAVYLAALCSIRFLAFLNDKNRIVSLIFIGGLYFFLCQAAWGHYEVFKYRKDTWYLPDYITRQISRCDYVFNGDGMMYNLYAKDPAYYWQLIGQLDVVGEQTGIKPRPDINVLIEKYKPKFIFGKNYFNKFAIENRRSQIVHYIDMDMVNKYYEPTQFYPIYVLKKEYVRSCQQNPVTGEWQFVD